MQPIPARERTGLATALEEQRETAREQLTAAWQLHLSRIEEQLHTGWQEHVERVIEERFADLAGRLEEQVRLEVEAEGSCFRERGRREAAEDFNRAVRRLVRHDSREEWAAALADAASCFAGRVALFAIEGQSIKTPLARGTEGVVVRLAEAPAFTGAVESRDTVVALCAAGELSSPIAERLEPFSGLRCWLIPILIRERAAVVLYADGETDVNGLEALAAIAGLAAERRPAAGPRPGPPESEAAVDWERLPVEERRSHLRAQRFARIRVAEMLLYKASVVRAGRAQRNLYSELREDIDAARTDYQRDFLGVLPSMVDYFHQELVRTLANDDPRALGENYPGPLV